MIRNERSRLVFVLTIIVMLALAVMPVTPASADSSGPNDAGTGAIVNGPGTVNWTTGGIPPTPTTTSLASSANPFVFGASVTFTAMVAPSAATGTVQFYADGAPLGSAATLSGGTATVSAASLSVGTHVITAMYSGDDNFDASTSAPLVQQIVSPACTSITSADFIFTPLAPKVGQPVVFTATVTGGTQPITFTWDYGDGADAVTTVTTAVHSFPLTNTVHTYAVTLTAANACSSKAATPKQAVVQPFYFYLPVIRLGAL